MQATRDDLTLFLANPDVRKAFEEAVVAAVRSSGIGRTEGSFNIDTLNVLTCGVESHQYALAHMANVPRLADRLELLRYASKHVTLPGPVLEFGVFSGETINVLATSLPERQLFGFDSFEGLPESWAGLHKGHFSTAKKLPPVQPNVELIVGWFDESLPAFLETHDVPQLGLLHIDCDLYSSTKTVFGLLRDKIVSGTIIVFDEYFNYPGWKEHEYLAFKEFIAEKQMSYEYIGIAPTYQHVAVRIL